MVTSITTIKESTKSTITRNVTMAIKNKARSQATKIKNTGVIDGAKRNFKNDNKLANIYFLLKLCNDCKQNPNNGTSKL